MLQVSDIFKKFRDSPEITEEITKNATVLVAKVSELLSRANFKNIVVSSGFRTQAHNKAIGGSTKSAHCYGQACDILDPDKSLGLWCQTNVEQLKELGLYMESLTATHKHDDPKKWWVHLTTRKPKSGSTIFLP